jgi:KDO2-lipid IV(A) lauroyltransferase
MQRVFYRLVAWLPFPLLYAVAWLSYVLLYHLIRYRRAVVRNNLEAAFPEKPAPEIRALERRFYRHLCRVAFEIVKAQRMSKDDFRERMPVRNPELLQKYSKDFTESVIVLTIHQGNWEWMLHGATTALDIPIDPVYKPLHNPVADRLIYDIRAKFGSRPLSMEESTRDILRRRREFRIFVMVADQAPIRSERSYWLPFLNRDAAFYLGTEIIAKMTGFPVLFAQCHQHGLGRYSIEFHELASPPYDKQTHEITERYVKLAEQAIREEPHSWLWSNRRWKRNRAQEEERERREQAASGDSD